MITCDRITGTAYNMPVVSMLGFAAVRAKSKSTCTGLLLAFMFGVLGKCNRIIVHKYFFLINRRDMLIFTEATKTYFFSNMTLMLYLKL